ncbi:MAG: PAS domain-containing protein, partial [Gemmatimonadales bacterium]
MPDNTPTSTLKALARLGADFSATDREDHIAAVLADTVSAMVAANSCTVALGPPDDLTVAARGPDDGKDSLEDIEELIRSEAIRADPPRSVGLPLAAGSRTYGAIAVRRDAPFTVEELAALNTASALAAVALRNAELVRLLATRRQEWEQTANAVPQALCLIDERGIVQRGNAAFADLVGLSLTAIQQREWIELVPESWIDPIGRIVAAPERNETTELSDSGRVYAATAIPAGAGEDSATILTFDDLTDRRELQNQLAQSAKMSSLGQLV